MSRFAALAIAIAALLVVACLPLVMAANFPTSVAPFRVVAFTTPAMSGAWDSPLRNTLANGSFVVVHVQPQGGATASVNATLKTWLAGLQASDQHVTLAALLTNGRSKPLAAVRAEVDAVRAQYGSAFAGFYVDNVAASQNNASAAARAYDLSVSDYVRNASAASTRLLFFNPRGPCGDAGGG
jgi:hypothetical protein